jgi:hypothetical protein
LQRRPQKGKSAAAPSGSVLELALDYFEDPIVEDSGVGRDRAQDASILAAGFVCRQGRLEGSLAERLQSGE